MGGEVGGYKLYIYLIHTTSFIRFNIEGVYGTIQIISSIEGNGSLSVVSFFKYKVDFRYFASGKLPV